VIRRHDSAVFADVTALRRPRQRSVKSCTERGGDQRMMVGRAHSQLSRWSTADIIGIFDAVNYFVWPMQLNTLLCTFLPR
jgi:hypothetical protein